MPERIFSLRRLVTGLLGLLGVSSLLWMWLMLDDNSPLFRIMGSDGAAARIAQETGPGFVLHLGALGLTYLTASLRLMLHMRFAVVFAVTALLLHCAIWVRMAFLESYSGLGGLSPVLLSALSVLLLSRIDRPSRL